MIAWLDLETTGLDENAPVAYILEAAIVITDDDLNEKAAASVVARPDSEIDWLVTQLDPVVVRMHTENKLFDDVKLIGAERLNAEKYMIRFVEHAFSSVPDVPTHECAGCGKNEREHHLPVNEAQGAKCQTCGGDIASHCAFSPKMVSALSQTPLAGSTISFDRGWLKKHMPSLHRLFHYRSIDISTVTELARRWAPEVYKNRPKADGNKAHRALADVRESINYARYYRECGFIQARRALPTPIVGSAG